MALNENIKKRRMQLKMSQEYVAARLGISRQAVAKWESGQSEPTAANLAALADLFELSVSALVAPQKYDEEQRARQAQLKEKQRNARMQVGRFFAVVLVNAGWDGYASGLYSATPVYWLAILAVGFVLLFLTSLDMQKKRKLEKLQIAIGAAMLFSIFFLPRLLPFQSVGVRYLLADIVTAVCLVVLNLKYWRRIWRTR